MKTKRKTQIKKARLHFAYIAAFPLTFDDSVKYLAHYQAAMNKYEFKLTGKVTPWRNIRIDTFYGTHGAGKTYKKKGK